jgi:hypothetical protein
MVDNHRLRVAVFAKAPLGGLNRRFVDRQALCAHIKVSNGEATECQDRATRIQMINADTPRIQQLKAALAWQPRVALAHLPTPLE